MAKKSKKLGDLATSRGNWLRQKFEHPVSVDEFDEIIDNLFTEDDADEEDTVVDKSGQLKKSIDKL
jgi:hypothetical protein